MNSVCTTPCLSRYARRLNVPYRGRHVSPGLLRPAPPCLRPRLPATRAARARLRHDLARFPERQVQGRCLIEPVSGCTGNMAMTSNTHISCMKSNIVPAPGLEPGRPSFKGWWAANYPTPDQHTLLQKFASAATVNPRYRPGCHGGISGSLGIHGSSATRFARDVPPCLRLPSLRSCGRGLRCGGRRCAGSRDSSRPRFSVRSSGCGASARGYGTDPATRR